MERTGEQLRDGAKAAWTSLETGANRVGEKFTSFFNTLNVSSATPSSSSSSAAPKPMPTSPRGAGPQQQLHGYSAGGVLRPPRPATTPAAAGTAPPVPPRPS